MFYFPLWTSNLGGETGSWEGIFNFFKAILNGLILYFKYNPNDTLDDKYISKKISLFK